MKKIIENINQINKDTIKQFLEKIMDSYYRIYYNLDSKISEFKINDYHIENFRTDRYLINEIFQMFNSKNFSLVNFSDFRYLKDHKILQIRNLGTIIFKNSYYPIVNLMVLNKSNRSLWHPWILKKRTKSIIFHYEGFNVVNSNFKNIKNTVTSELLNNFVRNLDNKKNFALAFKDKHYYPETYIYNKENKKLPDIKKDEIWFIKPLNLWAGKGIKVVNNNNNLLLNLNEKNQYIIQKGLTDLYLFNKKKGDIRVYYLMFFYKNELKFYVYKDGIVKITSTDYSNNNLDVETQLTNNSIKGRNKSNQLFLNKDLENYELLFEKSKDILTDISKEIKNKLGDYKSNYVLEYQLCGPDIIFDSNMKPYIFEINSTYPAFVDHTYDINEVILTKEYIAKTISKNLILSAINNEDIELEKFGFVRLL